MDVPAPDHANIDVVPIESTAELLEAVLEHSRNKDALIMAAAVADFRPASTTAEKIKKEDDQSAPTIVLEQTEDVLRTSVEQRDAGQPLPEIIVGFAAEAGDARPTRVEYARTTPQRQDCGR